MRQPAPPATRETACYGTLVFDDGAPVADEPVFLRGFAKEVARTGPDGRFRLVAARAAKTALMLGPEESALFLGPVTLRSGEDVEVAFTVARGVALDVTVMVAGSGDAVMNTRVRLDPEWSGSPAVSVRTDGKGRGTLRHVARAPYVLSIERSDLHPLRQPVDLRFTGDVEEIRVEMRDLTGLVFVFDGWPEERESKVIARFAVDAGEEPAHVFEGQVRTDGRAFLLAPPPGAYERVEIECDAWSATLPGVVEIPDAKSVEIRVPRPEGVRVAGVVLGETGEKFFRPGGVTLSFPDAPGARAVTVRLGHVCDFVADFVPSGRCEASVRLDEREVAIRSGASFVIQPEGLEGHEIRLVGGRVVGRVSGAAGAQDRVSARRLESLGAREAGVALASADGTFVFPFLPEGSSDFEAFHGGLSAPVYADVAAGGGTVEIALERRPTPVTTLVVTEADGRPLSGPAELWAREASGAQRLFPLPLEFDEHGRATCRTLAPGRWEIFMAAGRLGTIEIGGESDSGPIALTCPVR